MGPIFQTLSKSGKNDIDVLGHYKREGVTEVGLTPWTIFNLDYIIVFVMFHLNIKFTT